VAAVAHAGAASSAAAVETCVNECRPPTFARACIVKRNGPGISANPLNAVD
jgi:hypothetical protein